MLDVVEILEFDSDKTRPKPPRIEACVWDLSSIYRLQSDFAAAAEQEGVEPEPPFLALRNPFAELRRLRQVAWQCTVRRDRRVHSRHVRADIYPKITSAVSLPGGRRRA